jgi:hypothetical protein
MWSRLLNPFELNKPKKLSSPQKIGEGCYYLRTVVSSLVATFADFDEGNAFTAADMIIPTMIAPIRAIICLPREEILEFETLRYCML